MPNTVALVMIDIAKSRTILNLVRDEHGDQADVHYSNNYRTPCFDRIRQLAARHGGKGLNLVGDQATLYFDYTKPAVQFAIELQRDLIANPLPLPNGIDLPHLQLHVVLGRGSIEDAAYEGSSDAQIGAFYDMARILAITENHQILSTPDVRSNAGKVEGAAWHEWDVVLPKEQEQVKVLELLWDDRKPRNPKDATVMNQLLSRVSELEGEKSKLEAELASAVSRVQAKADIGDPAAREAIAQARKGEDPSKLQEVLITERDRQERLVRKQAAEWIELNREIAAVAYIRGDISESHDAVQKILALAKDDIDALNRLGKISLLRGDLAGAEKHFTQVLSLSRADDSWEAAALCNLGLIAKTRGQFGKAKELMFRALDKDRKNGNRVGESIQLNNLSAISLDLGEDAAAADFAARALLIDVELGRLAGQAYNLDRLAQLALRQGNLDSAEGHLLRSLQIWQSLAHLEGQASAVGNLAEIALLRGNLDEAENCAKKSITNERRLGRAYGEAHDLGLFARINLARGNISEARRLGIESRDLYARVDMPHMVKQTQDWLDGLPPDDAEGQ